MPGRKREIAAAIIQAGIYWTAPLIFGKMGPMLMVGMMLICTVMFSLWVGAASAGRAKYAFPLLTGLLFIPTVPVYYNSSAMIHGLWYAGASAIGLAAGITLNKMK